MFKGVILPLTLVFLLELAYRSILLSISKQSVPELQDDFKEADGFNDFLEVVIALGSTEVQLLLLTIAFMLIDKASSMYLWASSFMMYYIVNILQSLYAE